MINNAAHLPAETEMANQAPDPRMVDRIVIDPGTHVEALHGLLHDWTGAGETRAGLGCCNVLTPHFEALKGKPRQPGVVFVGVDEILATNLLLSPLGAQNILPIHAHMVVDVLLSVLDESERRGLTSVLHAALNATFENCSQHQMPVPLHPSEDLPEGISDQALSLMVKHRPPSFHHAAALLIKEGLMEDAMVFHARAMPSLATLFSILHSYEFKEDIYLSYGEEPGKAVMERLRRLIDRWVSMKPTNQPWNLSNKGVAVFQVDPGMVDCELPATTRWLMAGLMASYRRSSVITRSVAGSISTHAYDQPQHGQWTQAIHPDIRTTMVDWHKAQGRRDIDAGGVDLFDEMDGPIHSSVICNFFATTCREFRKLPLGAWIAGSPTLQQIKDIDWVLMFCHNKEPRRLVAD